MYKDRQIVVGESKWSELEGLKGICYRCGSKSFNLSPFASTVVTC